MAREVLAEEKIHPAVRDKIARHGAEILAEVKAAVAANDIVVVGMRHNPFPKNARKLLDSAASPTDISSTAATSRSTAAACRSSCGPAGPPFRWCS
jgi:hypothetical protein